MTRVYLREICLSFGRFHLFDGLSFECPEHAYLCLVGPSGCGKTTLLRIVAGLTHPDSGDIMIGGARVNDLPPWGRGVGLAFQNYALYPHLSVAENLAFPLRARTRKDRVRGAELHRRVRDMAALLQIEPLLHRSVTQLSGGQQQRVALGRSLICNPRVLLLDEPIAHLDVRLRYQMRLELKRLHQRAGTTTIQVTHDQQEALAVADIVAVLKDGQLEQIGPPLKLYRHPATAFVAAFIGDPPMSILRAELITDDGELALRISEAVIPLPRKFIRNLTGARSTKVLLGLRPTQVALADYAGPHTVAGIIYSHEIVGRQLELVLAIGNDRLRYRTDRVLRVSVGEHVNVSLALDNARLFDGGTGRCLGADDDIAELGTVETV